MLEAKVRSLEELNEHYKKKSEEQEMLLEG